MAGFTGKFDSTRQDWTTPDEMYQELHSEFGFTLDAAADASNTKCPFFFSKEDDALSQDWGQHTVWLNPPYGDGKGNKLKDWVTKAHHASLSGATVVMLIPSRTNTIWFHDVCLAKGEVRFIKGRPKFGDATHGLPQPLCLAIFRPPGRPKKDGVSLHALVKPSIKEAMTNQAEVFNISMGELIEYLFLKQDNQ